jgi:hypothetical protein
MITCRTETPLLVLAVTSLCLCACMPTTRARNATDLADRPHVLGTRQLITGSEIAAVKATNAFELIERLRPEFLNPVTERDALHSPTKPVIYVNGLEAGGVQVLGQIALDMVGEVRYVAPGDAFTRHGQSHRGGEIYIYLRRP